jgi:tRNA(fMet)-specific endonuclease VapC
VATVVQTLSPFQSLSFDDNAAAVYADIRHALEVAGQTIGPYDLQIAAICRLHGLTLVTSNTDEFSRVNGLQVEDWLQAL